MRIRDDKLIIRPSEYEENDSPYLEMLDENPHFKNLYFAKVIGDTFIASGMDWIVSLWKISK